MNLTRPIALALALPLAATSLASWAQATPAAADFPPEAAPIAADALRARLAGQVFNVAVARGPAWRLQFQDGGMYFINAGTYADNGKWRVEASRVCFEPTRANAGCNDMRLAGELLWMRRDNGEIVKFEPR